MKDFLVESFWIILAIVKVELIVSEYYGTEDKKADLAERYMELPSSTIISCVLACEQDVKCRVSGITADNTCFLFKTNPKTNMEGHTITLLRKGK